MDRSGPAKHSPDPCIATVRPTRQNIPSIPGKLVLRFTTEAEGFEPSRPLSGRPVFETGAFKPLCHASKRVGLRGKCMLPRIGRRSRWTGGDQKRCFINQSQPMVCVEVNSVARVLQPVMVPASLEDTGWKPVPQIYKRLRLLRVLRPASLRMVLSVSVMSAGKLY